MPRLVEFPQKKTVSAKRRAQAASPLKTGSVNRLKKKTSECASGNGCNENGSKGTPVPKNLVSVQRAADALRRLHIKPQDLEAAPQITPLLRNADGGLKRVLSALRFAQDEVIATFLEKYDSIPAGDRERLPLEAIALAAGVDMTHFLGSIMMALQAQAVNTVKIIAMTSHPKITRARVKYGQMASGERDRTALDTAMGFLPNPKGPTFIGKAIFGSGRNVMGQQGSGDEDEAAVSTDDDPDLDKLFPPANAMQEKLVPVRQKMLPEGH